MSNRLIFDADWLVPEQVQVAGQAIQYYAARNIQYVQHPVAAIQVLNVFVPAHTCMAVQSMVISGQRRQF